MGESVSFDWKTKQLVPPAVTDVLHPFTVCFEKKISIGKPRSPKFYVLLWIQILSDQNVWLLPWPYSCSYVFVSDACDIIMMWWCRGTYSRSFSVYSSASRFGEDDRSTQVYYWWNFETHTLIVLNKTSEWNRFFCCFFCGFSILFQLFRRLRLGWLNAET